MSPSSTPLGLGRSLSPWGERSWEERPWALAGEAATLVAEVAVKAVKSGAAETPATVDMSVTLFSRTVFFLVRPLLLIGLITRITKHRQEIHENS